MQKCRTQIQFVTVCFKNTGWRTKQTKQLKSQRRAHRTKANEVDKNAINYGDQAEAQLSLQFGGKTPPKAT